LKEDVAVLEEKTAATDFWNDQDAAQAVLKELNSKKTKLQEWETAFQQLEDLRLMLEMAEEEQDEAAIQDVDAESRDLLKKAKELELKGLLGEAEDEKNAILTIHPGAGGTESQDWAQMLMRMYLRWAERHNFKTEIMDLQPGEEAGIKSVTIEIKGPYAYGFLKSEVGVHRLVRISPFDAGGRRHTSFASVFVLPEMDEDVEIEINPNDLRIDTFRASGAGGQHVNRTDSAVQCHEDFESPFVSAKIGRRTGEAPETGGKQVRYRLGQSNSVLCIPSLQSGKRPSHWPRNR